MRIERKQSLGRFLIMAPIVLAAQLLGNYFSSAPSEQPPSPWPIDRDEQGLPRNMGWMPRAVRTLEPAAKAKADDDGQSERPAVENAVDPKIKQQQSSGESKLEKTDAVPIGGGTDAEPRIKLSAATEAAPNSATAVPGAGVTRVHASKPESLKDFVRSNKARYSLGVYLQDKKVGYLLCELTINTYEGKETAVGTTEMLFSIYADGERQVAHSRKKVVYSLEGEGPIIFAEQVEVQDGKETVRTAVPSDKGLTITTKIGDSTAERTVPLLKDNLEQDRRFAHWLTGARKKGDTFEEWEMELGKTKVDAKRVYTYLSTKSEVWRGSESEVYHIQTNLSGDLLEADVLANGYPIRGRLGVLELKAESEEAAKKLDEVDSTPVVIKSDSGRSQVLAPAGWSVKTNLHPNADLRVGNDIILAYLVELPDSKVDVADKVTYHEHARVTLDNFMKTIEGAKITRGPTELVINGRSAVQYEVIGTLDDRKFVYLHTTIDGEKYFHQLLAFTTPSRLEDNRKALYGIINSFTELK